MDKVDYYYNNFHLLGIQGMQKNTISAILKRAKYFNSIRDNNKKNNLLKDNLLINFFFEESAATKSSFKRAAKLMSADILDLSVSPLSEKKNETLIDIAGSINAMHPDFLILRHPISGTAEILSKHVECSIINAGDGRHEHPTQALLVAAIIEYNNKNLEGLNVVICGDILNSRVAKSNIHLLTTMGAEVKVVAPPTLIPKGIENMGVKVFNNLQISLKSADIIMILNLEDKRMKGIEIPSKREYYNFFGINEKNIRFAKNNVFVIHPRSINKVLEIGSLSIDNKEISLIKNQDEMGVSVRMACLEMLKISRQNLQK